MRAKVILATLCVFITIGSPQAAPAAPPDPKAVVSKFWKMETSGGRLTAEGWRAADAYFVRPTTPPAGKTIRVIQKTSVWNATVTGNTAEVEIGVAGRIWKIDPAMRISVDKDEIKTIIVYKLLLTTTHWDFSPDRQSLREVTGPPQWRIDGPSAIWITRDTAIRFLTDFINSTRDEKAKKNAEESLLVLKGNRQ